MVARAWGAVNGTLITFTQEGDVWKADIPRLEDGEYAVEIYAEDEAGNTSYLCTMLFTVSGHQLKAHLVPHGYRVEVEHQRGEYRIELAGCRVCND